MPSIADLVSRYSTADDVVNKTGDGTQPNGLNTILESPQVQDESRYLYAVVIIAGNSTIKAYRAYDMYKNFVNAYN